MLCTHIEQCYKNYIPEQRNEMRNVRNLNVEGIQQKFSFVEEKQNTFKCFIFFLDLVYFLKRKFSFKNSFRRGVNKSVFSQLLINQWNFQFASKCTYATFILCSGNKRSLATLRNIQPLNVCFVLANRTYNWHKRIDMHVSTYL